VPFSLQKGRNGSLLQKRAPSFRNGLSLPETASSSRNGSFLQKCRNGFLVNRK
jgi:hypothetical protein